MASTGTKSEEKKQKAPEDQLGYTVGRKVRWQIVAALHDGPRSGKELAEITGSTPQAIGHHIKKLEEVGAIELVEIRLVRNAPQHIYRAISRAEYDDDAFAELSADEKQAHTRLILQSVAAEAFAAWAEGTFLDDPSLWLTWDYWEIDEEGREEEKAEEQRHAEAKHQIRMRSVVRRSKSDAEAIPVVSADFNFVRSRPIGTPPLESRW